MSDKIKVKVVEVRTAILELDPDNYPEGQKDQKGMIEIELNNAADNVEYMDWMGADSVFTMEAQ